MQARAKLLSWASWMASRSIVVVTSAWLLAELTTSPLINSLLTGLQYAPAFLPLKRNIRGFKIFFATTILLELVVACFYFELLPTWALISLTLGIVLMASSGATTSLLPITGIIIKDGSISNRSLQRSSDIGGLFGTFVAGICYPCFKLFPPSLLLVLPAAWLGRKTSQPANAVHSKPTKHQDGTPPLDRWCLLFGFCRGALLSLLPLWILSIQGGTSIDFSFILGAFMIGRVFERHLLPRVSTLWAYVISALLVLVAFYPGVPIWLDIAVFIPLGTAITRAEFNLIDNLQLKYLDLPLCRDILLRSLAISAVFGSLTMGIVGQLIGVSQSMLLVVFLFSATALITWRWCPHPATTN